MYRVAKLMEIESAHRLSKHPGPCRYVHGHTRKIQVVIVAESLDENDMVCDFKAVKAALKVVVDKYDHAIYLNSNDKKTIEGLAHASERIIIMEDQDPTSEVLAKLIYDQLNDYISGGKKIESGGNLYTLRPDMALERVRVWETSTSWVEYEQK